jgi:hypothetical protein
MEPAGAGRACSSDTEEAAMAQDKPGRQRTPPIPADEKPTAADHPPRTPAEHADPHGAAPAHKAAQDDTRGVPTSDRHEMETAVGRPSGKAGQRT